MMRRSVTIVMVAVVALAAAACSLKPQHVALGPGGPAPPPAERAERERNMTVKIVEDGPADGAAGAEVSDSGPAATTILTMLLRGGANATPMTNVAMLLAGGAWDIGRNAVRAGGKRKTRQIEITIPVPEGHKGVADVSKEGTVTATTEPVAKAPPADDEAPPAQPDGGGGVAALLGKRFNVAGPSVQPEGIAPK